MYEYPRDAQDRPPLGWCERCGQEVYTPDPAGICPRCRAQKEEEHMSLQALAEEYRASAALLGERITALQREKKTARGADLERLNIRLGTLCAMYRQTQDIARTLEHYYDES